MKRYIKTLFIAGIALFMASCGEDFITKEPQQSLSDETAIQSVSDAEVALTGVYDELTTISYYGRDMFVMSDLYADNARMNTVNSGRYLTVYNWNLTTNSGYASGIWNQAYDVINRANKVIEAIETKELAAEQVKGEALAVRALAHFDLVRWFAHPYNINDQSVAPGSDGNGGHLGIPLMTESDPLAAPSRNTVAEVYEQVITDLETAMTLMSETVQPLRFDKWAAEGLLSRVYMYRASGGGAQADWQAAYDHATNVIENGPFSLIPNSDYISSWLTTNNSEYMFYLAYNSQDYLYTDGLGSMFLKKGYGSVVAAEDMLELIPDGDIRQHLFYATGGSDVERSDFYDEVADPTAFPKFFINKYPGRNGTSGIDNLPVVRFSEMYLNAAEAAYNLGQTGDATDYLEAIVERAKPGASITEYGASLEEQIYRNRRLELCYEGHRFHDLKRRHEDIVRNKVTTLTSPAEMTFPDFMYAYPIPQRELDANENITQNTGY